MLTGIKDRNVVPRWRNFDTTLLQGELQNSTNIPASPQSENIELVLQRAREWERSRTIWHAADLLNAAFVAGIAERYKEAASFICANNAAVPGVLLRLANLIVGQSSIHRISEHPDSAEHIGEEIRFLRSRLQKEGPSPIVLTDLARLYISTGKKQAAIRSMLTACGLAPTNRFVLRAASRLFLHVKDSSTALRLLRASPSVVMNDPWLIAAEVAISSAAKAPSAFAKLGVSAAADEKHSLFARSELNSALGTLEMESGAVRKARKLFGTSLAQPTENALAQAQYAKKLIGMEVDAESFNIARQYEANALNAYSNQMWERSVFFGRCWADDQPFSTRPAIFVSFVSSSLLENYETSIGILKKALQINPDSPQLINNLVFALASEGSVDEAERELRKVDTNTLEEIHRVALTATEGLILMRRGHVEAGRDNYNLAMELAKKSGRRDYEAMAAVFLAREECLAKDPNADTTLRLAFEKAGKDPTPEMQRLLSNALAQFARNEKTEEEA
jgi:tetratricopeptide (TPR) repeat protein